MLPLLRGVDLP